MKRALVSSLVASGLLSVGLISVARAQDAPSVVEAEGYPVGEHAVLHPTVGAEAGATDNVFYDNASLHPSGIFRLLVEGAVASKKVEKEADEGDDADSGEEAAEPAEQSMEFRAGGRLTYTEYLSTNAVTRGHRDLGADLLANLVVAPQGTFSFSGDDRFVRDTRPTNFYSTSGTNRIVNNLALALIYQPGGHAMKGSFRWDNQLDYFEDADQRFSNRMINVLAGHYEWEFFPYSKVFADASYGFIGGLGSTGGAIAPIKRASQPIRGGVGIATAITPMFTVKAHLGWAYASYAGGTGYNVPVLGAEVGYRYSPVGRIVAEYAWDHQDSIDADYYRDHMLGAHIDQQLGRIVGTIAGELRFRAYHGIPMDIGAPDRDDILMSASLRANYVFRDWLAAVAELRTETDRTAYRSMFRGDVDNPGYTRNELSAGIRAAF